MYDYSDSDLNFVPDGQTREQKIWSVSEINHILKELLEESFMPMWVSGEIGNLTLHRSGHVYFTMKDADSQIKAVFFSGVNTFRQMDLREGSRIEAFGRLTAYTPRGEYQLNVRGVRACGIGDLQRQFEELKQKLAEKGYFDEARKKPIPMLPRKIGVISSPSGAALQDFLKIALRRFPNLHIQVCPAPVQGKGAELKLARAIRFFNRIDPVDVIVLTRGGGSLEDLWPFNEEVLADAIFASKIPIVSAVGHEIDFTISDFTADFRAPTPSGAAEAIIPEKAVLLHTVDVLKKRAAACVDYALLRAQTRLDKQLASRVFRDSVSIVADKSRKAEILMQRGENAIRNAISEKSQTVDRLMMLADSSLKNAMMRAEHRLIQAQNALTAYDPFRVLQRGYVILRDPDDGKPVISKNEMEPGRKLHAVLSDGTVNITVDKP